MEEAGLGLSGKAPRREGHLGQKLKDERALARQGKVWKDVIGRGNSSCKSSEVRKTLVDSCTGAQTTSLIPHTHKSQWTQAEAKAHTPCPLEGQVEY